MDIALGQLVSPLKMKEHLVAQLKTQVADLERFINYLQADTKHARCTCGCALHSVNKKKPSKQETIGLMQKTAIILQMFAMLHFGCGASQFKKNDLKSSMKVNHWGWVNIYIYLYIILRRNTNTIDVDKKLSGRNDMTRFNKCILFVFQ